jgi:hypothetical protein
MAAKKRTLGKVTIRANLGTFSTNDCGIAESPQQDDFDSRKRRSPANIPMKNLWVSNIRPLFILVERSCRAGTQDEDNPLAWANGQTFFQPGTLNLMSSFFASQEHPLK